MFKLLTIYSFENVTNFHVNTVCANMLQLISFCRKGMESTVAMVPDLKLFKLFFVHYRLFFIIILTNTGMNRNCLVIIDATDLPAELPLIVTLLFEHRCEHALSKRK